jgi:hypothetical protein
MVEVILQPLSPEQRKNGYAELHPQLKIDMAERAVGASLAHNLLGDHPLGELQKENPEFYEWAKTNVQQAFIGWQRYASTIDKSEFDDTFDFDDVDWNGQTDEFILSHQEDLIGMYENAEANGINLSESALILMPLSATLNLYYTMLNGDTAGLPSFSKMRHLHGLNHDYMANGLLSHLKRNPLPHIYTKHSGVGRSDRSDDVAVYVNSRICQITGKDSVGRDDKPWDMFIIGDEYNSAWKTLKESLRNESLVINNGLGILEWMAATIQKPGMMASSDNPLALPANIFMLNGTEFVICAEYDSSGAQFGWQLMPTSSTSLTRRSIIRR